MLTRWLILAQINVFRGPVFFGQEAVCNIAESAPSKLKASLPREFVLLTAPRTPTPYHNVEYLPDGRRVPCVVPDSERATFITHAFKLFASGLYSLSQLSDELYTLGLRSRPTRRHPSSIRKVKPSTLQRLLRDPYYLGLVPYRRGTSDEQIFPGRHKPLIDEATFDKVQALLDEHRVSGERAQKHRHYLKGSVYCGECGRRLLYGPSRSKSGKVYFYFFAAAGVRRGACSMRANIRPRLIEEAVERHYRERPVQLTAKDVKQRTQAVEALVAASQQGSPKSKPPRPS
jgi:hypothetical protein